MVDDPHEIILDHLRAIRSKQDEQNRQIADVKEGQLHIRDDLHAIRGDIRRLDHGLASVEQDVERIKIRLDMVEE